MSIEKWAHYKNVCGWRRFLRFSQNLFLNPSLSHPVRLLCDIDKQHTISCITSNTERASPHSRHFPVYNLRLTLDDYRTTFHLSFFLSSNPSWARLLCCCSKTDFPHFSISTCDDDDDDSRKETTRWEKGDNTWEWEMWNVINSLIRAGFNVPLIEDLCRLFVCVLARVYVAVKNRKSARILNGISNYTQSDRATDAMQPRKSDELTFVTKLWSKQLLMLFVDGTMLMFCVTSS